MRHDGIPYRLSSKQSQQMLMANPGKKQRATRIALQDAMMAAYRAIRSSPIKLD
ncbi:hypothetical protein [Paenibacillus spongiae]|uniref:Uncharacterized protein n=1 Tax=Paenibacillus spongiae TaxID=2909671 RepID=A0ABY5SGF6_9BACL|nr:hypothetical protein [Paenibacillus spongiae]UVI33071.1 hypothetical protein L1F29_15060 [Paenibacillus spongiae]